MLTTGNPPSNTPDICATGALGCEAQLKTHTFDIARIDWEEGTK
jgi:hypothetical protein